MPTDRREARRGLSARAPQPPTPRRAIAWAAAGFLACGAGQAWAQRWSFDAGLSTGITVTNNAEVAAEGSTDAIFDVRPYATVRAEGGRIKVAGTAALTGIAYARGSVPNRLAPKADLVASVETIERLLFLDAGIRAFQTSVDPFGPRAESTATAENSVTTVQWNLSPRIEGQFPDSTRFSLRSENSWMRDHGATATELAPSSTGYLGRHSLNLARDPAPFGWSLEALRTQTRFSDPNSADAILNKIRFSIDYRFDADFSAGVNGGREESSDPSTGGVFTTRGIQARWQPSPRTNLSIDQEKRSFGSSWDVALQHRSRLLTISASLNRRLATTAEAVLDLPATDNVTQLLDSLFLSRFPDPIARAAAVRDFIARQGLPTSLGQPLTIRAQGFNIITTRRLGVSVVGIRSSVSMSAYETLTESPSDQLQLAGTGLSALQQHGLGLAFTHRLTPIMGFSVTTDWTRIRGLDAGASRRSIQRAARVQVNLEASPRTNAFAGARLRDLGTEALSGREAAVFAGVDHRF